MKNILRNKIILLVLVFVLLFSVVSMAATKQTKTNSTAKNEVASSTEESYEILTSDLYKFDSDINITEVIDGNLFACGQNVVISGEIGGDAFICGNNVTFTDNCYIHGNIFVCGQTVNFGGIAYDIYGACSNITLEAGSIIARDIKIGADKVVINGSVKRNAFISADTLEFAENAKSLIAGDLSYSSDEEANFDKKAVGGKVTFTPIATKEATTAEKITEYINSTLSTLLYSLVIILLILWVAPKFTDKANIILKKKALPAFGIGLLSCVIAIAFSIVFLLLTYGLGIRISLATIAIFVLALTISKTIFGIATGKILADKFNLNKKYQLVLLSLAVILVITLVGFIPVVGGIILFIANMLGLGIFTYNLISKKDLTQVEENK